MRLPEIARRLIRHAEVGEAEMSEHYVVTECRKYVGRIIDTPYMKRIVDNFHLLPGPVSFLKRITSDEYGVSF
jgi:hypothetical protein